MAAEPDASRFRSWLESTSRTDRTLLFMIFALSVGEGGARFLSPVYLSDQGTAVGSIGVALSAFGLAALGSRFLVGLTFRSSAVRATIAISALASTTALLIITTTSSVAVFTVLIAVHGLGWGTMATVLLTLVIQGKGKRSAAAIIGFYVGVEGLGRTGAPALAGVLGGAFGPTTGMRIHTVIFALAAVIGIVVFRNTEGPAEDPTEVSEKSRFNLARFRHAPLAAWVAGLTGFYLNTTNAVLNTFFPILGLTLGFSLAQIGMLAGVRSGVSALIRFAAEGVFKVLSFKSLFVPLYIINAVSAALIGVVMFYPLQFVLWVPNGASRGLLRVGTMATAMEDSEDDGASGTAALIGAGYDIGRIVGPAVGGLVASLVGMSTMFVAMPIFFFALLLPMALRAAKNGPGSTPSA